MRKVGARNWGWRLAGTEPPLEGGVGSGVGSGAEPTGPAEGRSQAGPAEVGPRKRGPGGAEPSGDETPSGRRTERARLGGADPMGGARGFHPSIEVLR